jgi:hypothetical protein
LGPQSSPLLSFIQQDRQRVKLGHYLPLGYLDF